MATVPPSHVPPAWKPCRNGCLCPWLARQCCLFAHSHGEVEAAAAAAAEVRGAAAWAQQDLAAEMQGLLKVVLRMEESVEKVLLAILRAACPEEGAAQPGALGPTGVAAPPAAEPAPAPPVAGHVRGAGAAAAEERENEKEEENEMIAGPEARAVAERACGTLSVAGKGAVPEQESEEPAYSMIKDGGGSREARQEPSAKSAVALILDLKARAVAACADGPRATAGKGAVPEPEVKPPPERGELAGGLAALDGGLWAGHLPPSAGGAGALPGPLGQMGGRCGQSAPPEEERRPAREPLVGSIASEQEPDCEDPESLKAMGEPAAGGMAALGTVEVDAVLDGMAAKQEPGELLGSAAGLQGPQPAHASSDCSSEERRWAQWQRGNASGVAEVQRVLEAPGAGALRCGKCCTWWPEESFTAPQRRRAAPCCRWCTRQWSCSEERKTVWLAAWRELNS
mmetsp:Transcript_53000/g.169729  ORF Transcript_53000/g.169729 Transcript_53000/m.169729 type:complete len:455 (+) Transcript_53000:101-1465(+)